MQILQKGGGGIRGYHSSSRIFLLVHMLTSHTQDQEMIKNVLILKILQRRGIRDYHTSSCIYFLVHMFTSHTQEGALVARFARKW